MYGFPNADAYAAITVSALIVYTSLGLGRRTLDVLLDRAPKEVQSQIIESLKGFEGIKNAHRIRIRKIGTETFVDMHIEVPRTFSHDEAHRLATLVQNKIKDEILPDSDVIVHVDAVEDAMTETIKDKIRLFASDFPQIKNIHSIYLSKVIDVETDVVHSYPQPILSSERVEKENNDDKKKPFAQKSLNLYLDVQMENTLSFDDAHNIVDEFEQKIKNELPSINKITTHIEIENDIDSSLGYEQKEEQTDSHLLNEIKNAALSVNGVIDCKDIALVNLGSDVHITLTIKIKTYSSNNSRNKMSIEEAHDMSTKVQNKIIEITGAARVVVHTEPA
ncbi:MAG TPA: cation transporter dimerization domain-containing protein [Candidatus Nitrosocosmicus sp.]|nr:cation transporter dimerization domain-containing protein [Candidatus Nitrosocosmicus sp.]